MSVAQKTVRIGTVGTNFISDRFIDAARETHGVEVVAVYSRKRDTGAAFAQKHRIKRVYSSYSDMLSDELIDAVYIASPIFMHKEQSVAALNSGKHVLCEKAIALSSAELLEMKRAAADSGLVLLEAMRPQFDPAMALVRKTLSRIGKPRRAVFSFCKYSSRYDDFKAGTVKNAFNPSIKNCALSDIGIYPLHICVSLFGEPSALTSSSRFLSNGFEGEGEALLDYGGFCAKVAYSKIRDGASGFSVEGELGTLTVDGINAPKKITLTDKYGKEEIIPYTPRENNMIFEISAFRDAVAGSISCTEPLSVTEKVMRTLDRISESSGILF